MSTIVTRSGKGSPLTHAEVDANFTNLNTDKAELNSPTFTGTVSLPIGTSIGNVSSTEIGYLDGVTSAIQTQINAKGTGTVTSVALSGGTTGLTVSGSPITTSGTITLAGTLAIANGGSGATTAQTAMNAFAGAITSGSYLRGNGTNVVMSAIQAADVPTLNQNTTGTASNVTGTVAVANGGTGATTLTGLVVGNGTSAMTTVTAPSGTVVGTTDTQTLTNKRTTLRIGTVTSAGTITPTADSSDQYNVTALATTASFAIPSGTPTDGQKLSIRIYAGTTQTISWVTTAGGYRVIGTTLPTSVPATKTIYVGCVYNAADSFWDVVAVATQA